jgi:hypothetical protein
VAAGSLGSPVAYAQAWAAELFGVDFRSATRDELLAWAQWEGGPLRDVAGVPNADMEKVLPDALTNPATGSQPGQPAIVPTKATWARCRARGVTQAITAVTVTEDPWWQGQVANGYQPHDRLMSILDVTGTVVQVAHSGSHTITSRVSASFAVVLGTAEHHGGYGVQSVGEYVQGAS